MTIAFLNGDFMPLGEARISPMDRGFLFGDGLYEVIPVHEGRPIGFKLHIDRLQKGMEAIEIPLDWGPDRWWEICDGLIDKNGGGNLALYLQVSRGADTKRHHAYPKGIVPTVFGFASELTAPPQADPGSVRPLTLRSAEDRRWRRCDIKSTALLGNVIHYQESQAEGKDETLLYNAAGEITEGSASNVFIVKDGVVATPRLDHQLLPGITRLMLLDMLREDGSIEVEERVITLDETRAADEIWLTSASKNVAPAIELDGVPVGAGTAGPVWEMAHRLFGARKFDY